MQASAHDTDIAGVHVYVHVNMRITRVMRPCEMWFKCQVAYKRKEGALWFATSPFLKQSATPLRSRVRPL